MINAIMEKCTFISDVHKCHIYWDIWKPLIRENQLLKEGFVYNSMNEICHPSACETSMIVSHFFYKFSQFIYVVERSRSNLPAQTTLQTTLQLRFFLNWNAVSQVKQKLIAWKNYQRSKLDSYNHIFINPKNRWYSRLNPQPWF